MSWDMENLSYSIKEILKNIEMAKSAYMLLNNVFYFLNFDYIFNF